MHKVFWSLFALVILTSLGWAQVPGVWEFDSLIVCGYTTASNAGAAAVNIKGIRNTYSVTLDPDGKIWCGAYYPRRNEATNTPAFDSLWVDTLLYWLTPIFVFDPVTGTYDSIGFLNLPGGGIDTLRAGAAASSAVSHRGMTTDPDGNIIMSYNTGNTYKINYQTHEVIAKFASGGGGGRPGVDAAGYVYQMDGVFATKVDILDPLDWTAPFNTITGISAGVTRCMEVSPNGQHVYICSQSGGLHHYYNADGVFGTYALVDTIMATIQTNDTTWVPFQTNLAQWHPSGLLWVASYDDVVPREIFALDPDQNYMVVDSLDEFEFYGNLTTPDTTPGGYAQPKYLRAVRDAYFDAAGNEFYAAEFYGYGIKKYIFIPATEIRPGQDSKVVPGLFTMYRNYPNPFNPSTTIPFELHKSAHVILRIYDSLGRQVGTYYDRTLNAGMHNFTFDASNLASGQYYFKLTVDQKVATGKMMLLK